MISLDSNMETTVLLRSCYITQLFSCYLSRKFVRQCEIQVARDLLRSAMNMPNNDFVAVIVRKVELNCTLCSETLRQVYFKGCYSRQFFV